MPRARRPRLVVTGYGKNNRRRGDAARMVCAFFKFEEAYGWPGAVLSTDGFFGQVCHCLKRRDIFRPAIGIAGIIKRVDADENIGALKDFGPSKCKGQENGVARGNIVLGFRRNVFCRGGPWALRALT